jgi:hypothetical protein
MIAMATGGYRYAVVVSEDHIDLPADEREGEVEYRYRNIAANPRPPSQGRVTGR